MRVSWLVLVVAACGDGSSAGPPDSSFCRPADATPIGCGYNATFELTYTGDEAQLANGTARACRNNLCSEDQLPLIPTSSGVGYGHELNGDLRVQVTAFRETGIEFVAQTEERSELFVDGDTYSLEIKHDDGTVLVEGSWTAHYVYQWGDTRCYNLCIHAELTPVP